MGIITLEPTPAAWISPITYLRKTNGCIHMYLEPKDINKAIIYEHHKAPVLEE